MNETNGEHTLAPPARRFKLQFHLLRMVVWGLVLLMTITVAGYFKWRNQITSFQKVELSDGSAVSLEDVTTGGKPFFPGTAQRRSFGKLLFGISLDKLPRIGPFLVGKFHPMFVKPSARIHSTHAIYLWFLVKASHLYNGLGGSLDLAENSTTVEFSGGAQSTYHGVIDPLATPEVDEFYVSIFSDDGKELEHELFLGTGSTVGRYDFVGFYAGAGAVNAFRIKLVRRSRGGLEAHVGEWTVRNPLR